MGDEPTTDQTAEHNHDELCSYAVDIRVDDAGILTNESTLRHLLRSAAEAGNAKVLGEVSHIFPNGAVTLVLVLSQSHLSVHTWPEFQVANVDLFAYGRLNAERMLEEIRTAFSPVSVEYTRVPRILG